MRFKLTPYLSSTKYEGRAPTKEQLYYWVFFSPLKKAIPTKIAVSQLHNMYPQIHISDVRIIKSVKRTKFVFLCNTKSPWTKT